MINIKYSHVDVFTQSPLSGNGLIVFYDWLEPAMMLKLTQEMRQFESIFLKKGDGENVFDTRIFTMDEELEFAGHPLLGAASALHSRFSADDEASIWKFKLGNRIVEVETKRTLYGHLATMNQGSPAFGKVLSKEESLPFIKGIKLHPDDIDERFPCQVISTGLPYLIIPVKRNLESAKIVEKGFENLLKSVGAKFSYVLDLNTREGRSWDNAGVFEDVATGSAAGPAGVYLVCHHLAQFHEELVINQGSFLGRASQIKVRINGSHDHFGDIHVSGHVVPVACGITNLIYGETA